MDPGKYASDYLTDLRFIERSMGMNDTFSYGRNHVDFEIYSELIPETLSTLGFALLTVFLVVIFITMNLQVTMLVIISVILVDFFVLAFAFYCGLTLNNFLSINLSFALGIAVDYSAHIAHTYLLVKPPANLKTN